ncbi:MAG: hypothetical protein J7K22_04540 [Nanoarchaeota archaeon]|nr:hypothetical protein [Nanoarchaeota archaeon]
MANPTIKIIHDEVIREHELNENEMRILKEELKEIKEEEKLIKTIETYLSKLDHFEREYYRYRISGAPGKAEVMLHDMKDILKKLEKIAKRLEEEEVKAGSFTKAFLQKYRYMDNLVRQELYAWRAR